MPPIESTLSQIDGKPHQRSPSSARPGMRRVLDLDLVRQPLRDVVDADRAVAVSTTIGRMSNSPSLAGAQPCFLARSVIATVFGSPTIVPSGWR